MKVFAIVVTYNGRQVPYWYGRCFTSLRESLLPVQTVVIDNASTDGTGPYLRQHFPEVKLIEAKDNLGFGRANNLGLRYALQQGAHYVFLLNQDAWIARDSLSRLVQLSQAHPEYGLLAPMNLSKERDRVTRGFMPLLCDARNTDACAFAEDLYFNRLQDVYKVRSVNASAWLIPRRTLESLGGFDPLFFHYGEDDNYLQRMEYHGFQAGLCPKVRVVHDVEAPKSVPPASRQSREKYYLVQLTDLTTPHAYGRFMQQQVKKGVKSLLRGKGGAVREAGRALRFALQMRKGVKHSRQTNQQKGPHWL